MDDSAVRTFVRAGAEDLLLSGKWGIEREALRVDSRGRLAATEHPFPPERNDIAVDFAENQMEFVTKPRPSAEEALGELRALHRQAYGAIGDEYLWPLSVPGVWDDPLLLRPASFAGKPGWEDARRYRGYLLTRYGRARQAISGVHLNFSFSRDFLDFLRRAEESREDGRAFSDRRYMDLARNLMRYRFLPIFLFSASPSIDPRFEDELRESSAGPARDSAAACDGRSSSLRLGPLGYRLDPERGKRIDIRFSSLEEYLDKLEAAVNPFSGEPLLRSAAEYYVPVRPKAGSKGEKGSLSGLRENGVEYLELRIFDLDPFEPLGIGERAIAFSQTFALACLFLPSPPLERDAASDDPLTFAASGCSYDWMGGIADKRLRDAIAGRSKGIFAMMEGLAPLLGEGHVRAIAWAGDILSGKLPRSAERFARMALLEGGGLEAGIKLAWLHREEFRNAAYGDKEAS